MDDLGLFPSFNTTRDHTRSQKSSAPAAEHTIPSQLVHVGITINPWIFSSNHWHMNQASWFHVWCHRGWVFLPLSSLTSFLCHELLLVELVGKWTPWSRGRQMRLLREAGYNWTIYMQPPVAAWKKKFGSIWWNSPNKYPIKKSRWNN